MLLSMLPLRRIAVFVVVGLFVLGCVDAVGTDRTRTSVVLVTLDTTRVDHLSSYGYPRPTTPQLDRLAARGERYTRAWSTSSWTLPAHASLFTSLYPSRHGAHYLADGPAALGEVLDMPLADHVRAGRLPDQQTTLAEILQAHGHRTAAFVAGPWLHRSFGLLQGYEVQDDDVHHFSGRPADQVTDAALAWLHGLGPDEPYFLFVNYFDAHAPYEPREAHAAFPKAQAPLDLDWDALMRGEAKVEGEQREVLLDRYDAEIFEMDAQLGRLLDAVLARSETQPTLVIVTADHGEALGDDGRMGHGFWLNEDLMRVPMIVRHADERNAGALRLEPIQLVDVLPLVLSELDLPLPDDIEGRAPGTRDVAFAELYPEATTVVRYGAGYDRELRVVIDWPLKLERSRPGSARLLRLDEGSLEEEPVDVTQAAAMADEEQRLTIRLEAHTAARPEADIVLPEVSDETVEALRQLGYGD